MPFANPMELALHFQKHGYKFGAATAADYQAMADAFMFGAMNQDTHECVRPSGTDRLRHNFVSRHFGCACINPAFVRTFYPISAAKHTRHGSAANFFAYECGRTNL